MYVESLESRRLCSATAPAPAAETSLNYSGTTALNYSTAAGASNVALNFSNSALDFARKAGGEVRALPAVQ